MLDCDASALLRYEGRQFIPLAIDGLAKDVLGRRLPWRATRVWKPSPVRVTWCVPGGRRSARPLRRPDPGQESLKVHACIGLPLFAGQNLIGALTLDGMSPDQFDTFSDEELRLIAALAAGALNNALLIEQLESQNLPGSPTALSRWRTPRMIGLSQGMAQLKKIKISPRLI
ncbi:GAF domain-containing protein [Enterobacter hormaechei]